MVNKEGYLLIDHTFSPGDKQVKEGAKFESATITCSHCNAVVVLNPDRSRPKNYCANCHHYICDGCAVRMAISGECRNFQKFLDQLEKKIIQDSLVLNTSGKVF